MNFFNLFNKEEKVIIEQQNIKINPFKPRGKEIMENDKELENIKIYNNNKNIKFDLKVYGKSIFQNLIVTASAHTLNNKDMEVIPMKCIWRRVKRDIAVYIQEVNSNSYIPTAEDIGYIIEVEARPIDTGIFGNEVAIGQYGPILLDEDMKNTIELLLTSGGTKFSCYIFDIKEQEKLTDREIVIYINPNELKLVETDYDGKEKLLESIKYHPMNPQIRLHPYDSHRFSLKFFEYNFNEINQINGGNFNQEKLIENIKSEYHLIAMSKQCRELIYLLIHFFLLDEKLKNSKLFSVVNYNLLPQETKVGVTDIIAEIKTLREENNVYMNNMKILEKMNKELREEMRNLEEDFQITLETINNNAITIEQDIEQNNKSKMNNKILITPTPNFSAQDLKIKCDELRNLNSSLNAKEKALREENKELLLNVEILKNNLNEVNHENKKIRIEMNDKEQDLISIKKSYNSLTDAKNKLQNNYDNILEENQKLKSNYENFNQNSEKDQSLNKTEIDSLKNKINELHKLNESLNYENKNLLVQRNLLSNQKEIIVKELDKFKKEKLSNEEIVNNLNEELENIKLIIKEREDINLSINSQAEKFRKENQELKTKFELLEIEHVSMKENFDRMFLNSQIDLNENENQIKISLEEYEEYDQLKKDKDESEALIMQLKSNNEAKDLEIRNLKKLLENKI